MKIKPGHLIEAKDAQAYRARRGDIDAAVKKHEQQVRDAMKKMGDLAVERHQIEVSLKDYAAKKTQKTSKN